MDQEKFNATKPPPGYNTNSQKYAAQKYEKEFLFVATNIADDENGNQDQYQYTSDTD